MDPIAPDSAVSFGFPSLSSLRFPSLSSLREKHATNDDDDNMSDTDLVEERKREANEDQQFQSGLDGLIEETVEAMQTGQPNKRNYEDH